MESVPLLYLSFHRPVTPDTPIRAISQSGPPIRESDATIREWELLYESGNIWVSGTTK
jgi:hypothetical protein